MSSYPNKVDDMIFFQDCSLDNIHILNTYNSYISPGKYKDANDYIYQQENFYGYFADFFNAIENRIYNLQDYLLSKPPKKQPFIYSNEEPTEIDDSIKNIIWT